MKKFVTKGVYMTSGVNYAVSEGEINQLSILECLSKHFNNEGDECRQDKKMNADAIKSNYGRVFSVFNNVEGHKLYIITDGLDLHDQTEEYPMTTILFPEEY